MKIKERLFKLLVGLLIFSVPNIGVSGAYFTDQASITGNTVSTGCWAKPTTPQLVYPENNYFAGPGSEWLDNPYMDWSNSTTSCPGRTIAYQYESYHDEGLTSLAYRSGLLVQSMIPAPGTPDGTYYWRVRSYDGVNWSDWSEVWLLIVDRSAPVVNGTIEMSAITEVSVSEEEESTGEDGYNLDIETHSEGSTPEEPFQNPPESEEQESEIPAVNEEIIEVKPKDEESSEPEESACQSQNGNNE